MIELQKHRCEPADILIETLYEAYLTGDRKKAAERLHIYHRTLDYRPRKLENRVGEKLFVRYKHDFELTDAGKELLVRYHNNLNFI